MTARWACRNLTQREDLSMQVSLDDARQGHVGGNRRRRALQRIAVGLCMALALTVGVLPSVGAAAPAVPVWDDFSSGFSVGPIGSSAKWFYFATPDGAFVGDDGYTFTAGPTLTVVPKGANPSTHLPAYSKLSRKSRSAAFPADWTT